MRVGTIALLALVAAGLTYVGPTAAFDMADLDRDVTVETVTDSNAYIAITGGTCSINNVGGWCTFATVTNKGNLAVTLKLTEEADMQGKISEWRIGGGTSVTTGWASTGGDVSVGGSAIIEGLVATCVCPGSASTVDWQVQGEKANKLNSLQTTIRTILQYS